MAFVVFLRGVNVGGARTFRPTRLARALSEYDVLNIGGAGTFVVRRPGSTFRAALVEMLPFEATMAVCEGRDLIGLEGGQAFEQHAPAEDEVRFVSILTRAARFRPSLPVTLPRDGPVNVRILGRKGRFVFGAYRRHMKTIRYLGEIDRLFGAPATTRSWNTIKTVIMLLKDKGNKKRTSTPG